MYDGLPSVPHTQDRAGFVLVDGKRVLTQPGEHLRYRTGDMLTCQHCGRRSIFRSMRVVSESDSRIGTRFFYALEPVSAAHPNVTLCVDCDARDKESR